MNTVTSNILDQFEHFRQPATNIDQYDKVGKPLLAERIDSFVSKNQPIQFAMLGFPFKSSNTRDKVLSPYPDMGEKLTMDNFNAMNQRVQNVYKPGFTISILSDGLVFNDIWGIPDIVTEEYYNISRDFGYEAYAPLNWYNIRSFNSNRCTLSGMRDKLEKQFGITEAELQHRIMYDQDVNYTYRGMIRFVTEEYAYRSFESGKARERAVKALVRRTMLRNEAYDNFVRHIFKDHIRLSMHQSVNNGKKYSIKLIDSPYARHSAWHSAVVLDGPNVMTMHKKDALEAGYKIVDVDGQPFYFTAKN